MDAGMVTLGVGLGGAGCLSEIAAMDTLGMVDVVVAFGVKLRLGWMAGM